MKKTCIVFSNGAPVHNYGPGSIEFNEFGSKISIYEGKGITVFRIFALFAAFLIKKPATLRRSKPQYKVDYKE